MNKSAKSVFVFAIYLFILSLILILAPNFLLSLFEIPETKEVWIRVVGMLAGVLGYYYLKAAINELLPFFQRTVYGRCAE